MTKDKNTEVRMTMEQYNKFLLQQTELQRQNAEYRIQVRKLNEAVQRKNYSLRSMKQRLEQVIKNTNDLLANAPERQVFYVDTEMSPKEATRFLDKILGEYKAKNAETNKPIRAKRILGK